MEDGYQVNAVGLEQVLPNWLLQMDRQAFLWINSHHNVVLDTILFPVSYLGEAGVFWGLVCLALLILGRARERKFALLMAATMLIMDRVIAAHIAAAFPRERPYLALAGIRQLGVRWHGSSFPSAHAHSVWIATIMLGYYWRKLLWPMVCFALLTCYARPYLGMHYPLDVIAGALLGILVGGSVVGLMVLWRRKHPESYEEEPAPVVPPLLIPPVSQESEQPG
jgi:undecaprenyl-diphosphatase